MQLTIKVKSVKSVNSLVDYWKNEDYRNLLEKFDFPDANEVSDAELKEMLFMAITDFEPEEAAEVMLSYKLEDKLTEGQIKNISHEMLEDKIAEEYPDPAFHYDLFNINQLLFQAFNGKFPNTFATIILIELTRKSGKETTIDKEVLLKAIQPGLKENSVVNRLYEDQLNGTEAFGDAEKVIWAFSKKEDNSYEIITSNYFIEKNDFGTFDFETTVNFYEEED